MKVYGGAFVDKLLSRRTPIFDLHLWAVMGFLIGAIIVLILFFLSIWITARCRGNNVGESNIRRTTTREERVQARHNPVLSQVAQDIQIDIGRVQHRGGLSGLRSTTNDGDINGMKGFLPEVSHLGWGRWYVLRELEAASNNFSYENMIGESEYGLVYYGVLDDNTRIAIKTLLNDRGQAQEYFKMEVDAIGRVRHNNISRLMGYCVEGSYRMLVYEYVGEKTLDRWLHGDVGDVSPLTWEIRMNIIIGCAKGLSYLHEGLEPKVIHRDIKSGNIMLDRKWHPKLSNFGLTPLLNSHNSYVTTGVMGRLGYVAPEYARTFTPNEKTDVYSFGILIMEIVTGKSPTKYILEKGEVNLDYWVKMMVGNKEFEEIVDPKLPKKPVMRMLKRAIFVALKCVDHDVNKRPKMGSVVHMLKSEDLISREECIIAREPSSSHLEDSNAGSQST